MCIYSEELYVWLRERGIDLKNGAVGENFTTRGVDLNAIEKGDRLRVGGCLVELTDIRVPCRKLNEADPKLRETMNGRSGWVAKVIEEADVKPGDDVVVVARAPRP